MIKQFVLIILLSLAAIFFRTELSHILDRLIYIRNYIAQMLYLIFSNSTAGKLMQSMISLLTIPVLAGFIVAGIFWLIKRVAMPHIMVVIWVLWLILLTTIIAQTNMVPSKQVQTNFVAIDR